MKKDTEWAKVTLPTTKDGNDYTFWHWDKAPADKVADGQVRVATFVKSGDAIDPNDQNPLPKDFHKVTVAKGTGIADDTLFGKTYAVKKDDTLAKAKFPELQVSDTAKYKNPAWDVKDPWAVKVADKDLTFTANATSAVFDKDNVTSMVVKTQPKLDYVEGSADNGKLDLSKLVVTLTDKNGNEQDVPFDKLGEYDVTANPANGTAMTVDGNNGKPVTLTKGKLTATTGNLAVTKENTPQASKKPEVNQPYVGDRKITGKGVAGATIVVKDKSSNDIGTTTVKPDGTWEVTVPSAEPLQNGETITATQKEEGKTPTVSDPVTVQEKTQPTKPTITDPAAKNEPGKNSTTVTGKTDPNTVVTVTDKDGKVIGTGTSNNKGEFTIETNTKQDPGTEVTITPKDGTPAKATVTEDDPNQSATPSINQPTEGDNAITGKGTPGAKVVVTDKDGKEIGKTIVGPDGKWSVPVPADRPLKKGDKITATQTENGKKPASAEATVKGKYNGGSTGGTWFIPWTPMTPSVEKPSHETAIHKAYIFGYEDNSFRPEGNMTRAEAAAMIARLQGLDLSNKARPNFIDVRSGWYNAVVNAVVNAGYMKGYPDGTFRPDGKITRAEFAQMIKAIDKANTGMAPFADAKGHWAEAAINQAYANARINGYPDGTFRPNNHITRAEAVTVFNKLYERCVGEPGLADVKGRLVEFNDINRSHWAYFQVVEASNTHEFYRTEKGKVDETWVRVLQTWKEALENR